MKIKSNLKELIKDAKIKEALNILISLVAHPDHSNTLISISKNVNSIKNDWLIGNIGNDERLVRQTRNESLLLLLIDELPSALELIKGRLLYQLKHDGASLTVIEILEQICSETYIESIASFRRELEQFQDNFYSSEGGEDQEIFAVKFDDKNLSNQLNNFVERLDEPFFAINWEDKLWGYLKTGKLDFIYIKESNTPLEGTSKFYKDVVKAEKKLKAENKGKFLLWQEEYLLENYQEAKQHCEDIRVKMGVSSSQIYEYLLLSYYKLKEQGNTLRKIVSTKESKDLKRLLLYIDRIKDLEGETETRQESLEMVYLGLLNFIHHLYQNISYDYIIDETQKGSSYKRNIIKTLIQNTLIIYEKFKAFNFDSDLHPVFEELLLEIEGGGKYNWLKIENKQLSDSTNFEARNYRNEVLKIFDSNKLKSELGDQLYHRLKQKGVFIQRVKVIDNKTKEKFIRACHLGFFLYDEREDFKKLACIIRYDENISLSDEILDEAVKPESRTKKLTNSLEDFLESLEEYKSLDEEFEKRDIDSSGLEQNIRLSAINGDDDETKDFQLPLSQNPLEQIEPFSINFQKISSTYLQKSEEFPSSYNQDVSEENNTSIQTNRKLDYNEFYRLHDTIHNKKPSENNVARKSVIDLTTKIGIIITFFLVIVVIVLFIIAIISSFPNTEVLFLMLIIIFLLSFFIIRAMLE